MKIPKTKKINCCRLCKNKKLIKLHDYGNHYVIIFLEKKKIFKGVKAPLILVYCKRCKLLQLQHSAPQEIMYKKFYLYVNQYNENSFKDIFTKVEKIHF